jgi:O-antigen/teichoic acid export membrane protein
MLVSTATGPVTVILLMAGKSSWNLANAAVALAVTLGLAVMLVPPLGLEGAAIAWAAGILVNNLVPLAQIWLSLRLHPLGPGLAVAAASSLACYGGVGALARYGFGATAPSLVAFLLLATGLYAATLWRFRRLLELAVVVDAVRLRRRAVATPPERLEPQFS